MISGDDNAYDARERPGKTNNEWGDTFDAVAAG